MAPRKRVTVKDINTIRTLIAGKLNKENLIDLTAPVRSANNAYRYQSRGEKPRYQSIEAKLSQLQPIQIVQVTRSDQRALFRSLLSHFHYLGYHGPVGENLQYLVHYCNGRILCSKCCRCSGKSFLRNQSMSSQSRPFTLDFHCLQRTQCIFPAKRSGREKIRTLNGIGSSTGRTSVKSLRGNGAYNRSLGDVCSLSIRP